MYSAYASGPQARASERKQAKNVCITQAVLKEILQDRIMIMVKCHGLEKVSASLSLDKVSKDKLHLYLVYVKTLHRT